MKKRKLIWISISCFYLFTLNLALAETDADRLNRLEKEIQLLRSHQEKTSHLLQNTSDFFAKYNMRFYGRVKVDINYDTAEFKKYNDFIGPLGKDATNDSVNFNCRDVRFGLETSHTEGDLTVKGRIETDFYGDNNGDNLIPRMRLGYVDLIKNSTNTSLRVGQDWIPVAQQNPATIDFGILSTSGNLWWRVPQVTIRQKAGNFEFLLSAMRHRRKDTEENDRMPWALGRIAYKFGKPGNLLALGGGYRNTNDYDNSGEDITRTLAALEFKCTMGTVLVKAEGFWGEAIDNEFLRYDMGVNTSDPDNPDEIESIGGFISVTANISDEITLSAGYGIDDPDNDDMDGMKGTLNDRQFTKNSMMFLNSWYKLTKGLKTGAEIIYAETERFSSTDYGLHSTVSLFYNF